MPARPIEQRMPYTSGKPAYRVISTTWERGHDVPTKRKFLVDAENEREAERKAREYLRYKVGDKYNHGYSFDIKRVAREYRERD